MAEKSISQRRPWQFLNSAHIQIIAILTMVFQHATMKILGERPWEITLTNIGAIVSRVAFPLFCFMLVEGLIHTSNRAKYAARLLIFALASVIPYTLFTYSETFAAFGVSGTLLDMVSQDFFGNVLFELLAGYLMIWGISRSDKWLILAPLTCVLSDRLGLMYGWYGIAMILCFYGCRDDRKLQALSVFLLSIIFGYVSLMDYAINPYGAGNYSLWAFIGTVRAYGMRIPVQCWAAAAALPILFYSGERGHRLPKYAGYIFYPAHLLLLGTYAILFPA